MYDYYELLQSMLASSPDKRVTTYGIRARAPLGDLHPDNKIDPSMSNKNIGGKKSQLCDQKKKLISEVFNVFDTDGDGQLNYLEFKSACKALGCPTKKVEILKTIKSYARTGVKNNCIEFSDFFDVSQHTPRFRWRTIHTPSLPI
ncbi:centrin-3-like [Diaphorina citri]|uniref:Centrin-3-like n=1 Tax=Diaphorina citri TaxID=121845 RepID=A0A1S3DJW9_DIACI|nr:centrin-3-like [Diaphorina citri]